MDIKNIKLKKENFWDRKEHLDFEEALQLINDIEFEWTEVEETEEWISYQNDLINGTLYLNKDGGVQFDTPEELLIIKNNEGKRVSDFITNERVLDSISTEVFDNEIKAQKLTNEEIVMLVKIINGVSGDENYSDSSSIIFRDIHDFYGDFILDFDDLKRVKIDCSLSIFIDTTEEDDVFIGETQEQSKTFELKEYFDLAYDKQTKTTIYYCDFVDHDVFEAEAKELIEKEGYFEIEESFYSKVDKALVGIKPELISMIGEKELKDLIYIRAMDYLKIDEEDAVYYLAEDFAKSEMPTPVEADIRLILKNMNSLTREEIKEYYEKNGFLWTYDLK